MKGIFLKANPLSFCMCMKIQHIQKGDGFFFYTGPEGNRSRSGADPVSREKVLAFCDIIHGSKIILQFSKKRLTYYQNEYKM